MREIHSRGPSQNVEYRVQAWTRVWSGFCGAGQNVASNVRMPRNPRKLLRDPFGREHIVHTARLNRASRHAVILRRRFVLRKRYASMRLDFGHSHRSVRTRAGQNHAYRAIPFLLRKRAHEVIHGHVRPARFFSRTQVQRVVRDGHRCVWRDHVNVVWLYRQAIGHFRYAHRGFPGEQFRQDTMVFGVKMLYQDKGHSRVRREVSH